MSYRTQCFWPVSAAMRKIDMATEEMDGFEVFSTGHASPPFGGGEVLSPEYYSGQPL